MCVCVCVCVCVYIYIYIYFFFTGLCYLRGHRYPIHCQEPTEICVLNWPIRISEYSLIWVHTNPGLRVRPHCEPELFNANEPSLSHIPVLITDEHLSYMKYRRTGRGNPMRLGKSNCHNHLDTDNRNASPLICDHVSLLRNQVLCGLPWTMGVPDVSY